MTKKDLRPLIPSAKVNSDMSSSEQFQNLVLRPILKLQYPLIIDLFKHHLAKSNTVLHRMEVFKKNEHIQHSVTKNQALKNQYIGMITGLFTQSEFATYLENPTEHNKRIVQMTVQRLQDSF